MQSKIRLLKHPMHPLVVHLPIGLWVTSLIFDILALATGMPVWAGASFWTMVFGSGFALIAAIPGFVDYLFLDMSREAHRLATYHMLLNLTVVAIFVADILWRLSMFVRVPSILYFVPVGPFILSIIAVLLLSVSGWLGGQLVYHHHLGVEIEHPSIASIGAVERPYRPANEQQHPQL